MVLQVTYRTSLIFSFISFYIPPTQVPACPGKHWGLQVGVQLGLCAATKPWAQQHPWNAPVIGACTVVLVWHWLNPKLLMRMNGLWLYLCSTEDFLNAVAFFFKRGIFMAELLSNKTYLDIPEGAGWLVLKRGFNLLFHCTFLWWNVNEEMIR